LGTAAWTISKVIGVMQGKIKTAYYHFSKDEDEFRIDVADIIRAHPADSDDDDYDNYLLLRELTFEQIQNIRTTDLGLMDEGKGLDDVLPTWKHKGRRRLAQSPLEKRLKKMFKF